MHGGWSRILKAYWQLDGVPDVEVDRWLMVLVTKLRPRVFIPQEQIIEENSLPRHMFIVSRGLIGVLGKVVGNSLPQNSLTVSTKLPVGPLGKPWKFDQPDFRGRLPVDEVQRKEALPGYIHHVL